MNLNFEKNTDGLIPAIIQDSVTRRVLMLGYMNEESLQMTMDTKKVTFYSRSRKRIWTKGEESGNFLDLIDIKPDCDRDTLLISVRPTGPTCHTGTDTCWGETNSGNPQFLEELENIIGQRKIDSENTESYVTSLFRSGINKVAQKVGEEAVEMIIEAKDDDDQRFLDESADLLFHYLILLQAKGFSIDDVLKVLKRRNSARKGSH